MNGDQLKPKGNEVCVAKGPLRSVDAEVLAGGFRDLGGEEVVLEVVSGVPGVARGETLQSRMRLHVELGWYLHGCVKTFAVEDQAQLAWFVEEKMGDANRRSRPSLGCRRPASGRCSPVPLRSCKVGEEASCLSW